MRRGLLRPANDSTRLLLLLLWWELAWLLLLRLLCVDGSHRPLGRSSWCPLLRH